jgi:hypothetical protein
MMVKCFKYVIEYNKKLCDHMKKVYSEANSALSLIPPRLVRQSNSEYIFHEEISDDSYVYNDDIDFDNNFETFTSLKNSLHSAGEVSNRLPVTDMNKAYFHLYTPLQRERAYGINESYISNDEIVDVTEENNESNQVPEYSLFGKTFDDSVFKSFNF